MISKYRDFFEPEVATRLGRLNIIARQAVEGFVTGLHKSPHFGFAIEFAEHRPYTPGDDIRRIDWLAYARTERFYVKLNEQQTNLRAQIILDASSSMDYASNGITKFQYARYLAALLGYLMLAQQDAVGLSIFSDSLREHFNPSARMSALQRMFDSLEQIRCYGTTAMVDVLNELASRLRQRGLIIIISDMMDDPQQLMRAMRHFIFKKHQLIVFHLIDPAELEFPFENIARFVDSETQEQIVTDPRQIRTEYLSVLNEFLSFYRKQCADAGIEYLLVNTAQRYDRMLVKYLTMRRKLIK